RLAITPAVARTADEVVESTLNRGAMGDSWCMETPKISAIATFTAPITCARVRLCSPTTVGSASKRSTEVSTNSLRISLGRRPAAFLTNVLDLSRDRSNWASFDRTEGRGWRTECLTPRMTRSKGHQ